MIQVKNLIVKNCQSNWYIKKYRAPAAIYLWNFGMCYEGLSIKTSTCLVDS